MKVLIVGSGGREHALAWKAARSGSVEQVLVAPGNAGTAREPKVANAPVAADDLDGLVALAGEAGIDLTIVGPEAPLAAGIVDRFEAAGLKCFGPSQQAARLESSKAFAKEFLVRHGIPTAEYTVVENLDEGMEFVRALTGPVVLKADGLAAGKGVVITENRDVARETLEDMLSGNAFGAAGSRVVIEEFLVGEEASFIAIADGETIVPLASSQDHKRRDDGDGGPNTGGMGACSPAPVIDTALHRQIINEIMQPTVAGMAADGSPFTGFLYAGLMITADGPRVLEFNVRFGDPEAQPVLMRLESDLVELLSAAIDGDLAQAEPQWDRRAALGVVMAAGGYPEHYAKGKPITGLDFDFPDHIKVFHAGTTERDGQVVTAGGRVLCVTAVADTIGRAQAEAYLWLPRIGFEDAYFRTDIGHRAAARERAAGGRDPKSKT